MPAVRNLMCTTHFYSKNVTWNGISEILIDCRVNRYNMTIVTGNGEVYKYNTAEYGRFSSQRVGGQGFPCKVGCKTLSGCQK